jgi:uncharacterized protein YukE
MKPLFRKKTSFYETVLDLIIQSASLFPSHAKSWRRDLWDGFMDHHFFELKRTLVKRWKELLPSLLSADLMSELLGKLSPTTTTTSLFVSKDAENTQRRQSWRRVSFIIFQSEVDKFYQQLPVLQEKLVDAFKSNLPELHAEVAIWDSLDMLTIAHHLNI